ncbi:MAG TPA: DNA polymerase IV [Kineosporiaceae bacterium]|nr:DNA polymerase IV [Kineosporiaceae bacterium]
MRDDATIWHVDLDCFFAAVEQRDKPSLKGKPVLVGGAGPRSVVSTASYEARRWGVHSGMPMGQARLLCPTAAVITPRLDAYRIASAEIFEILQEFCGHVEMVGIDEAYLDVSSVACGGELRPAAERLRVAIRMRTGGLTASVGAGTSKVVAKVASAHAKPDGVIVVPAGGVQEFLDPLPVDAVPGVGPATEARLKRIGVVTVGQLRSADPGELQQLLGVAHAIWLLAAAAGLDPREVVTERESAKSVSHETTFETDLTDPVRLLREVDHLGHRVADRLAAEGASGRTVTVKVRFPDFTTITRSRTVPQATCDPAEIASLARGILDDVDTHGGVRLLGVGVSALSDWQQPALAVFDRPRTSPETEAASDVGPDEGGEEPATRDSPPAGPRVTGQWKPGQDVEHSEHGRGWVWGVGNKHVTVRFETPRNTPGTIRTFLGTDPELRPVPAVPWGRSSEV